MSQFVWLEGKHTAQTAHCALEVIGGHWRSLIRLITLIRLDPQWRGRLHSRMWMDGIGWDGYQRS